MLRAETVYWLRKRLLRHGLTLKPVCPRCGFERQPREFGDSGACLYCERAADLEGPDGLPPQRFPHDEIVDNGHNFEVGHG